MLAGCYMNKPVIWWWQDVNENVNNQNTEYNFRSITLYSPVNNSNRVLLNIISARVFLATCITEMQYKYIIPLTSKHLKPWVWISISQSEEEKMKTLRLLLNRCRNACNRNCFSNLLMSALLSFRVHGIFHMLIPLLFSIHSVRRSGALWLLPPANFPFTQDCTDSDASLHFFRYQPFLYFPALYGKSN